MTESMKGLGFVKSDVYYFRKLNWPWYACDGKRCAPVMIIQEADLKAVGPTSAAELYKYVRSAQLKWAVLLPDQLRWSPSISALLYLEGTNIVLRERMELVLKCAMSAGKISVAGEANCTQLTAEAYKQLQEAVGWAETGK